MHQGLALGSSSQIVQSPPVPNASTAEADPGTAISFTASQPTGTVQYLPRDMASITPVKVAESSTQI